MSVTVETGNYVDFYDLLNALDWDDQSKVDKARKMAKISLEHTVIFNQFFNHKKNSTKKPERPTIHD